MNRGLVVFGFPRSGTTLVRRLIDAHPRFACPPETGVFAGAARMLQTERIDGGVRVGIEAGLGLIGVPSSDVRARVADLAMGFLADHAASQGKPRWAEKHPYDVFHREAITGMLGDRVRYLIVVRHGLDVALSCRDLVQVTGRYLDGLGDAIRRDPRPLHAMAASWSDTTVDLLAWAKRHSEAVPVVRYEDLVADPLAVVRAAFSVLGEDVDDGLVDRALATTGAVGLGDWRTWSRATVDATSAGKHRTLAPDLVAELGVLAGPGLEAAGYDRPGPPRELSPEAALRRHQLAMMWQARKA